MKRLNPETGKPFKQGDVREDGRIFQGYNSTIGKNGYQYEKWLSPTSFKKAKKTTIDHYQREMSKRRSFLNAYKLEKGCACCGYNEHSEGLEFDHINASEKKFHLGVGLRKNDLLKAELAKC